MKRLIQTKILTPVAKLIIGQDVKKGGIVTVNLKGAEFVFDVRKKRKSLESAMVMPEALLQK